MRRKAERLVLSPVLLLVSLLGLVGSPPALGQSPSIGSMASGVARVEHITPHGTIDPEWAWVVDLNPTQAVVNNLGPLRQGNSFQANNVVNRLGVGSYRVTRTSVGATSGNVLVSAIASKPHSCLADSWSQTSIAPASELVYIRCYDEHGSPIDSSFVVNWLSASDIGGRLGYGTDEHPTSCGVAAQNAFDTFGGQVTVCPYQAPGQRFASEMTFPYLGSTGGTVQITAMTRNALDEGGSIAPALCTLRNFEELHPSQSVYNEIEDTICQDYSSNSTSYIYVWHNAWFMDGVGLEGAREQGLNGKVAYLFAGQPMTAYYTPGANRRFSSLGGAISIARQGVGRYVVQLARMPAGGSVQVTAFGAQILHCTIVSISQVTPQKIGVRCFNAAGALTDSRFTLAYTK
jgi:hypothetical protein